jgi:hypothetical protein
VIEMTYGFHWCGEGSRKPILPDTRDDGAAANELCEKALNDAINQLHPLLQQVEPYRLVRRPEFLRSFRSALERRIARKLAIGQPDIQAIFRYDETGMQNRELWDGSIRLLVKVPRLSNAIRTWSKEMDRHLVKYLERMALPQAQTRHSILEIHQVTPRELRHGVGYGAMFFAVYSVPSKIWPQDR